MVVGREPCRTECRGVLHYFSTHTPQLCAHTGSTVHICQVNSGYMYQDTGREAPCRHRQGVPRHVSRLVCNDATNSHAYNAVSRQVVLRRLAAVPSLAHLVPFIHALSGRRRQTSLVADRMGSRHRAYLRGFVEIHQRECSRAWHWRRWRLQRLCTLVIDRSAEWQPIMPAAPPAVGR